MKKVFAAVALLILVFAGAVFALPLVFSSDSLRSVLAQQLSAASDARISLAGPVRFSVLPDFGILADDLAYESGDGSLSISSERTVASVRWASLLSDRIEIAGVELENPRIVLGEGEGGGAEASPGPREDKDIFKLAASYLERLAIDRVRVRNGEIVRLASGGSQPIASGIDLDLSVPGIDKPASLAFSGTLNGVQAKFDGKIGSLRDLLERQPAEFSLSAEMSPPPHPALASLGVSGRVQLAGDGSYRLEGGEVRSAGQPMRIDAAYIPGARPYVKASIRADILDYADFEPAAKPAEANGKGDAGKGGGPDLSPLRDIDLDVELKAGTVRAGNAAARDFFLEAELRDGKLKTTVGSQEIAGGQLALAVFSDFNDSDPEFKGYVNLTAIDIESLAMLAGRKVPASGQLTSKLQYAFRGIDENAIRNTINLAGTVAIAGGGAEIPELAAIAGPRAGRISALDAKAEITNIEEPLAVSGTMTWNGENVGFASSVALADLLSGSPGALALNIRSRPVEAKFSGVVDMDGSAKGNAVIQAGSLSALLRWGGRDPGSLFGRFSYSGAITATKGKLALDGARIALDDMVATGSATIDTAGKTSIRAALSVNALDFARLTGGGETSGGASPSGSSPSAIDLSVLRDFDADVRLDAERIGYGEVKAGPATAVLTVSDGVARLSVPRAGFYDGAVTANVFANGAGNEPAIDIDVQMKGVTALQLFRDAAGFERIEGKLDAALAVKGSGTNTDALARSLDGNARVVFADGALRGIDVAKLVNNLQSLIKGGYKENAEDRTEFTELSVSFDIENGVARTKDLKLLGPLVRMDGSGSIDLAARSIDMRLNPRVVGSLDGQGGEFDAAGLGMPVIIAGPLSGPRVYPDITNILADPGRALQTLSRLGEGIGALKDGAVDPKGVLEKALGTDSGAATDNVVKGVIERLNKNGAENNGADGTPENGTRDLVGSLLQGVLGGNARKDQAAQPENPAVQPSPGEPVPAQNLQPASETPQDADAGAPENKSGDEPAIVLPTQGPILVPNPRRLASAPPSEAKQEPEPTVSDQASDQLAPAIAPEGAEGETGDFIKGLLKNLGD